MKKEYIEIEIPFSGFYHTLHGENIDHAVSCEADNLASDYYDIGDFIDDYVDYNKIRIEYAKVYADEFINLLNDELGLTIEYDYSSVKLHSPKFYNYVNDSISLKLTLESWEQVFIFFTGMDAVDLSVAYDKGGYTHSVNDLLHKHYKDYTEDEILIVLQYIVNFNMPEYSETLYYTLQESTSDIVHDYINWGGLDDAIEEALHNSKEYQMEKRHEFFDYNAGK